MTTLLLAQTPPQATWWQLAPYILLAVVAIVVGLLTSRRGPR